MHKQDGKRIVICHSWDSKQIDSIMRPMISSFHYCIRSRIEGYDSILDLPILATKFWNSRESRRIYNQKQLGITQVASCSCRVVQNKPSELALIIKNRVAVG
jgi:hypothetical protein